VDNRGVPGATSGDLRHDLDASGATSTLRAADVVLITIGANDFSDEADAVLTHTCGDHDALACSRTHLRRLQDNLHAIVSAVRVRRQGRPTAILVSGYWNVYEDGAVADRDYQQEGRAGSDRLTRAVNRAIQAQAEFESVTFVDLVAPFKGPRGREDPTAMLADDGDHPNAVGHQRIADALLAVGMAPLPPP
jgi:lysophospholipase L1-like esterase